LGENPGEVRAKSPKKKRKEKKRNGETIKNKEGKRDLRFIMLGAFKYFSL
jgi:hypothetical protein